MQFIIRIFVAVAVAGTVAPAAAAPRPSFDPLVQQPYEPVTIRTDANAHRLLPVDLNQAAPEALISHVAVEGDTRTRTLQERSLPAVDGGASMQPEIVGPTGPHVKYIECHGSACVA